MQSFLRRLNSQSAREASRYPAFMGSCLTISHGCYPYLPGRWVLHLVPGVAERTRKLGESKDLPFLFMVLIRWNEKRRWAQDFYLSFQRFESFHSDLPLTRWRDIVGVECLWIIKSMVVGFCLIGVWCYSEWWVWDLITLAQFYESEMPPGLFQDFMDGSTKF